jgi:hypothetical protein
MLAFEVILRCGAAMVATVMMRPSAVGAIGTMVVVMTGERRQRDKAAEQHNRLDAQAIPLDE